MSVVGLGLEPLPLSPSSATPCSPKLRRAETPCWECRMASIPPTHDILTRAWHPTLKAPSPGQLIDLVTLGKQNVLVCGSLSSFVK